MISSKQAVISRYDRVASRVPNPLPPWASTSVKFVLCGTVGAFLWILLLAALSKDIQSDPSRATDTEFYRLFAVMVIPTVPAAMLYRRLPSETVDWYHRFGKASALFFVTNVSLSASFLVWSHYYDPIYYVSTALDGIITWAFASIFLPGTYLGILVAARWSR